MTLKTLGMTTFDKIKVGEVFFHHMYLGEFSLGGCVCIKVSEDVDFVLEDTQCNFCSLVGSFCRNNYAGSHKDFPLYRLPKSVQRLWVEN
jgi:hypothetical protein